MTVETPGRPAVVAPRRVVTVRSAPPIQREVDDLLEPVPFRAVLAPPPPPKVDRHPHWSGLDGLRAVAVIAVVAFHFTGSALPGGFLGVDVFFGISGYLITRLVVREWLQVGWIDLGRFYRRRARRLLPALAVVVAAVCVAALAWRDQLATLRPAVLAATVFGSNWWLALAHQSYFVATGRPTMLQHLWSLGVEEQFYLVWPLLVIVLLTWRGRAAVRHGRARSDAIRGVVTVALLLAAGSTALSWWLADRTGLPYRGNSSLLYYGTETHCMGLFLGAALGAWAVLRQQRIDPDAAPKTSASWLQVGLGAAALAGLGWMFATVDSFWYWLYRGGFALAGVLVCIVIAAATAEGSPLGRALDQQPLRWIGLRSYSIYLWHWPVAIVTRPGLDNNLPVLADQALRIALVLGLSELTYRFIEAPARRVGLRAALTALGGRLRPSGIVAAARASAAAALLAALALVAIAVVVVGPNAPTSAAAHGTTGGRHLHLLPQPEKVTQYSPGRAITGNQADPIRHRHGHAKPPRGDAKPPAPLPRLSAFGDSVLLDARAPLGRLFNGGRVDAVVGRQPFAILADAIRTAEAGRVAPVVVLHVGDNGVIDPAQLTRALHATASARLVLVLTLHLDPYVDPWQDANNATIRRVVPRFANAHVVDWDRVASDHPGWLYPDGIHLTPDGSLGFARMLATAARSYLDGPARS